MSLQLVLLPAAAMLILPFTGNSVFAAVIDEQVWNFDADSGGSRPANSGTGSTLINIYSGTIGNTETGSYYTGGYLHLTGGSGSGLYQDTGAGAFSLPTNLFGIEFQIRSETPEQAGRKAIFRMSGDSNTLSVTYNDGGSGIAISKDGSAYVDGGAGTRFSLDDKAWHSLAVVALDSVTNVYWDGVLAFSQNVTFNSANSNFHLGIKPGGGETFAGDIDNLRYFTFAQASDFNAGTDLTQVPEPSTYALFGGLAAAGIALAVRRRKNAK